MNCRSALVPRPHVVFAAAAITCLILGVGPSPGQQTSTRAKGAAPPGTRKAAEDVAHKLDGAWRLVKALDPQTRQLRDLPPGIEMTKLIVGGRFAWIVTRDGQAVAGAGGTYTVTPNAYAETVTFAVAQNQQPLVGSTTRFTYKLEGGKWYHKGTLRVGQARQDIDEVWERIP